MNEDDTIRALRRISYEKLKQDLAETEALRKENNVDLDEFLMVRGWDKDELIARLIREVKEGNGEDTEEDDYYADDSCEEDCDDGE